MLTPYIAHDTHLKHLTFRCPVRHKHMFGGILRGGYIELRVHDEYWCYPAELRFDLRPAPGSKLCNGRIAGEGDPAVQMADLGWTSAIDLEDIIKVCGYDVADWLSSMCEEPPLNHEGILENLSHQFCGFPVTCSIDGTNGPPGWRCSIQVEMSFETLWDTLAEAEHGDWREARRLAFEQVLNNPEMIRELARNVRHTLETEGK